MAGQSTRALQHSLQLLRRKVSTWGSGGTVGPHRFSVVNLGLTERCDFHCRFCHRWKKEGIAALDLDHYRGLIDQLSDFMVPPAKLRLAGGEVLLLPELPELVCHASRKGWAVEICTNGWYLDKAMARRLGDCGVALVAVSLDSLDPRVHDELRGKPGATERVLQALEAMGREAPQVHLTLMTLILKQNLFHLVPLVRWADAHPHLDGVFFQVLYSNLGDDWRLRHTNEEVRDLLPQPGETSRVLAELAALKQAGSAIENEPAQLRTFALYYEEPFRLQRRGPCPLAEDTCVIDEYGMLRFCPYSEQVAGEVFATPLAELLDSNAAREQKERMQRCTGTCYSVLNCLFKEE